MIIRTIDLININEAAKALKQKDFMYYNYKLYGIDNIDGYITWVDLSESSHEYINYEGFVFNARELSAFVKDISTEEEFNIVFNPDNNTCILYTINDTQLHIRNDNMLLSIVQNKINAINKERMSCEIGPGYSNFVSDMRDITNEVQDLFGLRKTDGCYYYKTIVRGNNYFMTLFYGLLPLNKSDKVFLSIYEPGINSRSFMAQFMVVKKKFKVNMILCYLKV